MCFKSVCRQSMPGALPGEGVHFPRLRNLIERLFSNELRGWITRFDSAKNSQRCTRR